MMPPDRKFAQDGNEILFVRRWNTLVSALIVEPSVKLVARTAVDYGLADGAGIYPGNERMARETGYSAEGVRTAWATLRACGMAERVTESYYDGRRRVADEYKLVIPDDWRSLPVYGPNMKRFHCQQCGKVFDPQAGTVLRKDGAAGWRLPRMVFCPEPGKPKTRADGTRGPQRPSCFTQWGHDRVTKRAAGWGKLPNGDAWAMFYAARGDEWPTAAEVRAADERANPQQQGLRIA